LKSFKFFLIFIFSLFLISKAETKTNNDDWSKVIHSGMNKSVNFHAWGGSRNINNYIKWVSKKVESKYNITLNHIKIKDTAQAVKKVLYEKISGENENGSIDIIWINGENFSSMLSSNLLYDKNWIFKLPNSKLINLSESSSLMYDFGVYNEGREMPWGLSQLIFFFDSEKLLKPPKNVFQFKKYILDNKGRITFPQPPDFVGTSFLKQVLSELTENKSILQEKFNFKRHSFILAKLWEWLDDVTPNLWKRGKFYPKNYLSMSQLLGDDEIDISMAFNVSFPSNEVIKGNLPKSTKSYVPDIGSLSNVHYLTIPYNSSNPSAAKLVINFMISPEAQLRKNLQSVWGDPTVLNYKKLPKKWKNKFEKLSKGPATISFKDLDKKLAEPHPSWVKEIEKQWMKRYGTIN
tara:strand:+ start:445 stop:1662 length:1218 start_codon:yes stop_codon:yes gene_type:complete